MKAPNIEGVDNGVAAAVEEVDVEYCRGLAGNMRGLLQIWTLRVAGHRKTLRTIISSAINSRMVVICSQRDVLKLSGNF